MQGDRRIQIPDGTIRRVAALVYRVNISRKFPDHQSTFRPMDLPKGWPQRGKTFAQSALMEAFEEAGVRADSAPPSIGSYNYEELAMGDSEDSELIVSVLPVQFSRQE